MMDYIKIINDIIETSGKNSIFLLVNANATCD